MADDPFDFANTSGVGGTATASKNSDPFDFAGTSVATTTQPDTSTSQPMATGSPFGDPKLGYGTASYVNANPGAGGNGALVKDTSSDTKNVLEALQGQEARPAMAIAGGVESLFKGENPVKGAIQGYQSLYPEGWGGVISAGSGVPQEKFGFGQKLAAGLGNAIFDPFNAVGLGELTNTGKAAEKVAELAPTLTEQAAKGQRTLAGVTVPFTNKTIPLVPKGVSTAAFKAGGQVAQTVGKLPIVKDLNAKFNTAAGLTPDLEKMKTLNYDAPRIALESQKEDLFRAHQAEVAKIAINTGQTNQDISRQVLAYNELPLRIKNPTALAQAQEEMAKNMHPDVLKLANDRKAVFNKLQELDQHHGATYTPKAGYEAHHITPEFREYLDHNPGQRKLFNQSFGPGEHRKIDNSILTNNALSEKAAHPDYPGFKGKMLEDDISRTYANRVGSSLEQKISHEFFNAVAKKHGMTPEDFEAAKNAFPLSGVKASEWAPFPSRPTSANAYFGVDENGVAKRMMLPKDVADNLNRTINTHTNNPYLSWLKPVNAAWRPTQISTPGNAFRDIMLNYPANAMLRGLVSPAVMFKNFFRNLPLSMASHGVLDPAKLEKMTFKFGNETLNGRQVMDEFRQMAFTGGQSGYLGRDTLAGKNMGSEWKAGMNKAEMNWKEPGVGGKIKAVGNVPAAALKAFAQNPWFKTYFGLRGPVESAMRGAYTMALREKGWSAPAALLETKNTMWDWKDLTPFQQNELREVMPFAVWGMKNLPFQAKMLLQNPGRTLGYERFRQGFGGPQQQEDSKSFNDWYKNSDSTRLGGDPNNPLYAHLGGWWATSDLNELAHPLHYLENQLAPALQLPWEMANNKSLFFNEPLENFSGEQVPYSIPGGGKVPVSARYEKPLLDEALPLQAWNRATKIPLWQEMLRAGTGLNVQPMDMDKAQGAKRTADRKAEIVQKENIRRETNKYNRAGAAGDKGAAAVAQKNLQTLQGGQAAPAGGFDPFNFAGGK